MSLKSKLEEKLNKVFQKVELNLSVGAKILIGALALFTTGVAISTLFEKNDIAASSVMITNIRGDHGGTGVILSSRTTRTEILTNSHVCKVVEGGGTVSSRSGTYSVSSYKHSKVHDICLITVDADLGITTKIASRAPVAYYEKAKISGHPALLPNVMTSGHFSGRKVISVMTGIIPCTAEDKADDQKGFVCLLLGGLPNIRRLESILVTATIMPGSSGSGVFNESDELVGLAFAGSDQIGYAWTVPYESMMNFLNRERGTIKATRPSNQVNIFEQQADRKKSEADGIRDFKKACETEKTEKIKDICNLLADDMIWYGKETKSPNAPLMFDAPNPNKALPLMCAK